MLVALMCFDKPNSVDLRMKLRPEHLAWIDATGVKFAFAGPMLNEKGEGSHGSVIVGEFESLEAAEAFSKADPYRQNGLFERVVIKRTFQVYPKT
jgi:hypothetical protein